MESWLESLDGLYQYEISAFRCYTKEEWKHICSSMEKYDGKIRVPLCKNLYILHDSWDKWKHEFFVEEATEEQVDLIGKLINDEIGAIEAFNWLESMRKYELALVK